jgi:hypothetical protein
MSRPESRAEELDCPSLRHALGLIHPYPRRPRRLFPVKHWCQHPAQYPVVARCQQGYTSSDAPLFHAK